eukprot:2530304-Rhodomonas_salina.3
MMVTVRRQRQAGGKPEGEWAAARETARCRGHGVCLWCDASCEALVLHSCEISSRPGCVLQGRTPLTLAFGNGHEAMASLLVDKGADVNAKGNAVSPARRPFVQMTG